jgi:hypothetical protein
MDWYQIRNNAYTYLEGSLDTTSTSLLTTVENTLPTDTSSGFYYVTLYDVSDFNTNEIITVTGVADHSSGGKTLTIQRAKQGTTAQSWTDNTPIGLNITADSILEVQDNVDLLETYVNTNISDISGIKLKTDYITITQPVDLDQIETDTTTNNAKVSNATHTGEVIGSTSLTIDPVAISGKTGVTPASGDYLLLWDATDSLLKKADVATLINGSYGDVTGPASSTDTALALFSGTGGKTLINSSITSDGTSLIIPGSMTASKQIKNTSQYTLADTGSVTWNINDYPSAKLIPTGNVTLTVSGVTLNSNASLYFVQYATTAKTVTWDGAIIWSGGYAPDLSTLSSKHLFNFFSFDGTGIYGASISNSNRTVVENSGGTTVNNAIAIFDSTTGGLIKDSAATLDVTGNIAGLTSINSVAVGNYLTTDSTSTLTNKRNTSRVQTITDATSITFNSDLYDAGKVTLAGNRTLGLPTGTPTNFQLFELEVVQDATGSRTLTFIDTTSANGYRIGADLTGITLSTAANKKDLLLFQYLSDITGFAYIAINKGF